MKKWNIVFAMLMVMLLAACGSDDAADGKKSDGEKVNESATNDSKVLAEEDFAKMYSNPKKYKNYALTFTGKIFMTPEKDEDGTYIQMYADPENSEKNMIVAIPDPELAVSDGDYIVVTGKVKDEFKGENMLGGEVKVPLVTAETIEVVDYQTVVAPTLNSIEVQQEQNQHGVQIILEKIEFAKAHTRVYVKVKNDTPDQITIHAYSTKLAVGNQQYESDSVYEADYPEVQTDILPGIESAGIITFPAIDPNTTALQYHIENSSDNWELDFTPFVFKVE